MGNRSTRGAQVGADPRIVSLIASATEIVHALGAGDWQIGRSHECDWPQSVQSLPALTRAKFKVEGSSREIDERVKELVKDGLAVYEVDATVLEALAPDVILTQDQCEVCAVSLADVERAVCKWTGRDTAVVSLRPHTLDDLLADIVRVAEAIGRPDDGARVAQRMRARLGEIADAVRGRGRPKFAFIEWIDPPMSGGHWMPEIISIAGGASLFGETGANSPWISWGAVAAADPDVILVGPCGFDLATTEREMAPLVDNEIWCSLRAVREGAVWVADGNAFFNRPGPRIVESTEILAEIFHPEVCNFGHCGSMYRSYKC
ncbi:MAG: cobalamin-binding protein [Hyphomicrobiaceae bacterium]